MPAEAHTVHTTWQLVVDRLLDERTPVGYWIGELSSSALATATAVSALCEYRRRASQPKLSPALLESQIEKGVRWLLEHQNEDGGWGDTDISHSNIATTFLALAALKLSGRNDTCRTQIEMADRFIDEHGRIDGLRRRYGRDKTFAVPILANCAIAGLVDWREVSALPCEAAAVPQSLYRFLGLPVVSYAIPALVAIGQAKSIADPSRNPFARFIRRITRRRGLRVLAKMQPASGGYLEAIPLTSFVVMSLAHSGRADHPVTEKGVRFILNSFRDQEVTGTWPIDTNLATWNTTLAVNAICSNNAATPDHVLTDELLEWLLECQYKRVHPYTGAAPGGWGWSDLSGSVPDADDTPGALLACRQWITHGGLAGSRQGEIACAARAGIEWLLRLQNRDRGWPTFCRGWGKLPFDRSGSDITAHVIRALWVWREPFPDLKIDRAVEGGFEFLERSQREDGSWLPLWFGNQDEVDDENPVYGTSKVLLAFRDADRCETLAAQRGYKWLINAQNNDGGWGGGPSFRVAVERRGRATRLDGLPGQSSLQETSLALESLAIDTDDSVIVEAREKGLNWLMDAVNHGYLQEKWPIGFYFAKLWYYERLYPMIFAASALGQYIGANLAERAETRKTLPLQAT